MAGVYTGIFSAVGMLMLIIDSRTAFLGALEGVDLCIKTVLPALTAFIFLSQMLCGALRSENIRLFHGLERILRIPNGTASIYLTGLLGGYPTGAQLVSQAYRDKLLNAQQGNRLLAFCSNAGPAFVFGIIAPCFSSGTTAWALWIIHILSSALVAWTLPGNAGSSVAVRQGLLVQPVQALKRTVFIVAQICGWVILFRVLTAFIQHWVLFLLPKDAQVAIMGIFELTAGCAALNKVANEGLRFMLASGFLAFGGICVGMQTASVCNGLQMRAYLTGKILQCTYSLILAWLLQYLVIESSIRADISPLFPAFLLLLAGVVVLYVRRVEKKSRFSDAIVV